MSNRKSIQNHLSAGDFESCQQQCVTHRVRKHLARCVYCSSQLRFRLKTLQPASDFERLWINPEDEQRWWSGLRRIGLMVVVSLLALWLGNRYPSLEWPMLIIACICLVLTIYIDRTMPGFYRLSPQWVRDHVERLRVG